MSKITDKIGDYSYVTEANTIVDSYVNGQRKQMTEQFRNSENKPEVLDYIRSLHGTDMVAAITITFFTFDQNGWA